MQALDPQRGERLELHRPDLTGDALDHHPVADPRGLPDARLDRLQPVGQELEHGDPAAAHRGAGIGSVARSRSAAPAAIFVAKPDRRAWPRRPVAESGAEVDDERPQAPPG
jgi:hypothetical protein